MPRTVTSAFSEPMDFEAALRKGGCLSLLITGRGPFRAQLTRVTLHRLHLSMAEERLSRIAFVAVPGDMVVTVFPTVPVHGGIEAQPGEIMILPPGEHVHVRTDGLRRWGSIWVPVEELVRYSEAVTGTPFAVPPIAQRWRPPPAARRRLRSLHASAMRMAAKRPQALLDAETAHALEQQLIHALVECLSAGAGGTITRTARRHRDIMARFERLLQTQPDRDMRTTEICAMLGISDRLLRSLCAEHLGMSPRGYNRLRRKSAARRTLRRENGVGASASEIERQLPRPRSV
jgi:AraC-like DNA-binding protein